MARVMRDFDPRIIERTRRWLVAQQRADGSFAPDTHVLHDGVMEGLDRDTVRITAFIGNALRRVGGASEAVAKARRFVASHLDRDGATADGYTLSLAAQLLAGDDDALAGRLLDRLWQQRKDEGRGTYIEGAGRTLTHGGGQTGVVEATALATLAMLAQGRPRAERVDRTILWLTGAKDTFGAWHSTQATIRALQALLANDARHAGRTRGTVHVDVDGDEVASVAVDGEGDALSQVDLAAATKPGAHAVSLRFEGTGELSYQLAGRWYEPRRAASAPTAGDLSVETHLDATELGAGGVLGEEVRVNARTALAMPIVTAGLPPGFDVDPASLDELLKRPEVQKVQQTPREVVLYLRALKANASLALPFKLTARLPARVLVPSSTVYEYYQPEHRATAPAVEVRVRG